jgi:serine/threonine protein kinase
MIGKTIDRYRILEQLGQGGMAIVYQAFDTRLDRDVAIKLIRRKALPEEQLDKLLGRFEREAKAQARFNHPNIVPVYDFGDYEGAPYLVMALLSGGTLKERTGSPMSIHDAAALLAPVASALAYAHERNVLHRDVKPSNVLIDENGTPFLTDFGIAKLLETDQATLTGTGLGVGTPEYMAPEQWKGQSSPGTDIYALGVVLYELVTGKKPYTADTPAAVAIMQVTEALPLPHTLVPGFPDDAEKLILKALALNPADRFESMREFEIGLSRFIGKLPAEPGTPSQQNKGERSGQTDLLMETLDQFASGELAGGQANEKPGWRRWAWIGLGAIALGALSFLGYTYFGRSPAVPGPTVTIAASAPTSIPESSPVVQESYESVLEDSRGHVMKLVAAGEFIMGSNEGSYKEGPAHLITLDAFYIDVYEVTNRQYAVFLNERGNQRSQDVPWYDLELDTAYITQSSGTWHVASGFEDHPVAGVTWYGARVYCLWRGAELPTEAQWEKAARGNTKWIYPWGTGWINGYANSIEPGDGYGQTAPVGQFSKGKSPYDIYDMSGNVWEWVLDWYWENYYSRSTSVNPDGPDEGTSKVLRGGSWTNNGLGLRVIARYSSDPLETSSAFGFRCALTP